MSHSQHVTVVGAGLSGLAAARRLRRRGTPVVVFEKSGGLGGRLATRRVDGMPVDHGCPLLDAPAWTPLAAEVAALGRHERVSVGDGDALGLRAGMTRLPKSLATGVDVRRNVRVGALARDGDRVEILDERGTRLALSDRVIISAPGPQAAELLETAGDAARARALRAAVYSPALVVLAGFRDARGPAIVESAGPFARIVREDAKSRRAACGEAVVSAQLSADASRERFDESDEGLAESLLEPLAAAVGAEEGPRWWQVKRWRYATPANGRTPDVVGGADAPIVLCGDALTGANLAGVYASGVRAAELVRASIPS